MLRARTSFNIVAGVAAELSVCAYSAEVEPGRPEDGLFEPDPLMAGVAEWLRIAADPAPTPPGCSNAHEIKIVGFPSRNRDTGISMEIGTRFG
jgi:hypothetical protein